MMSKFFTWKNSVNKYAKNLKGRDFALFSGVRVACHSFVDAGRRYGNFN